MKGIACLIFICLVAQAQCFLPSINSNANGISSRSHSIKMAVPLELEGKLDPSKFWDVELTFNGETKTVNVSEETCILEAAETVFDDPPFSCRNGVCTTCSCLITEGTEDDNFKLAVHGLGKPQRDAGYAMSCQTHITGPGVKIALGKYDEAQVVNKAEPVKNASKTSYAEWIKSVQIDRNKDWQINVMFEPSADTPKPPQFDDVVLFKSGVEEYAMGMTTVPTPCVRSVARATMDKEMFAPCMVGTLESQFLKTIATIKGAKKVLDVGTFTGMSAVAFAEALPADGEVVTLECYEDIAAVAQENFNNTLVRDKIRLMVGSAEESMRQLQKSCEKFDIVFLDADKENYIKYYEIAMNGLLSPDGIILADNSLCALLYDSTDERSTKLHEFNHYVKNDPAVDQVVLTVREGVTLITRK